MDAGGTLSLHAPWQGVGLVLRLLLLLLLASNLADFPCRFCQEEVQAGSGQSRFPGSAWGDWAVLDPGQIRTQGK